MNELPFVDYAQPTGPFSGLVILGEAPGAEEVRQGRPFVGRSGKLLQEALTAAGIERDSCLVANVFRYRPPDNKVSHFFISERAAKLQGAGIFPLAGRMAYGVLRSEYSRELANLASALIHARAVITLGAVPLWALTKTGILKDGAGQAEPIRGHLCKAPIFPTYHPAFILRGNRNLMPRWIETMQNARQHVERIAP